MHRIPLFSTINLPEMEEAAVDVLRSGKIASGAFVTQFEAGIGKIVDQTNVVSTNDMTTAMFLALYLAGVRDGDEVVTTAFACMATNSAIAHIGAIPIWVDVKPKSVEFDVSDLAAKLSVKTKAIILYHVAGYPGPAKELAEICQQRGIALIEDCNNSLFSYQHGRHVGAHGDFSIYSFYPNRQINTAEGGALVCKDAEVAKRARSLRRFGIDAGSFRNSLGEINSASDIPEIGWTFTLNNLNAALGCAQLPGAEARVDLARKNAAELTNALGGLKGVHAIPVAADTRPAYWVLLLLVEHRDVLLQKMKERGVDVSGLHQRNDIYSGFRKYGPASLPNTAYLQEHIIALPCGWWLSPVDMAGIVSAFKESLETLMNN